jgi:hypothetical protein
MPLKLEWELWHGLPFPSDELATLPIFTLQKINSPLIAGHNYLCEKTFESRKRLIII